MLLDPCDCIKMGSPNAYNTAIAIAAVVAMEDISDGATHFLVLSLPLNDVVLSSS